MICLDEERCIRNYTLYLTVWEWRTNILHSVESSEFARCLYSKKHHSVSSTLSKSLSMYHHYMGGRVSVRVFIGVQQFGQTIFQLFCTVNLHANWLTLNTSKHWLIVSVVGYGIVVMRFLSPSILFRCGWKCWQENLNYWTWPKKQPKQNEDHQSMYLTKVCFTKFQSFDQFGGVARIQWKFCKRIIS